MTRWMPLRQRPNPIVMPPRRLNRLMIATIFVLMHSLVVFAGATCCLDEVIKRHDACIDEAEAESIAEASKCEKKIIRSRISKCLDEVHERHQERKADCRSTRDEEMKECNI